MDKKFHEFLLKVATKDIWIFTLKMCISKVRNKWIISILRDKNMELKVAKSMKHLNFRAKNVQFIGLDSTKLLKCAKNHFKKLFEILSLFFNFEAKLDLAGSLMFETEVTQKS